MKKGLILIVSSISLHFSSCTSWRVSGGTSTTTTTTPTPIGVIGQRVKVLQNSTWYDATILNVSNDNQYYVHYEGWGNNFDEWVTYDRVQFLNGYGNGQLQIGQQVKVLQNGTLYDATILQITNTQCLVEYIGYGGEKEWVSYDRIQSSSTSGSFPPTNTNVPLYAGQKIQVYLNGVLHPATILQIINSKYYVRYEDITFYEWITIDRIR